MTLAQDIRLSIRLGRAYRGVAACRDRFIVTEGPRGTAKTRSLLTLLMLQGMQFPGTRIALARAKRTALTETVLNTLEQQVFPALKMAVPGGAQRENRSSYHVVGDNIDFQIVPIGLDNPEQKMKLFSSEWTKIYVAEAGECEKDAIEMLAPTLRAYPPAKGEAKAYVQCLLDHNPLAPGHWLYKRTEDVEPTIRRAVNGLVTREQYEALQDHNMRASPDPRNKWKRIVTKHMDNPGYWDFDGWEFTELGRDYLATLDGLTGFQRRRMLDGEACAAEGSVFPEFEQEIGQHVVEPFGVADWKILVAFDAGYDHPAAVIFVAIAPDGQLFVIDEIYGSRMRLDEIAAKVEEKINRNRYNVVDMLCDPACNQHKQDASGRSIVEQMNYDHGLKFRSWPGAKGADLQAQVEAVRSHLTSEDKPLQVFRTCSNLIMEMQSWSYKRMADGSMPAGDDAYEDRNNHAIDCLRGVVATRPTVEKPLAKLGKRAS